MKKIILNNLKTAFIIGGILFAGKHSVAQCTVTSSNGWVATFSITPTAVIPTTTNCQWSYNYDIRFDLKITFSGSNTNRSVSGNIYFTCSGGNGGLPYRSLGSFSSNTNSTGLTTTNNARGYNAVTSYNYGSNPSCTTIKLADVHCTSYRIDYWGNGVTNGSFNCTPVTPLPIELLYFDANYSGNKVNFKWATASEKNNDYFSIERSRNGSEYETIIQIKGAGNSSSPLYYSASDIDPPSGTAYYRLKQTDYNGEYEYSNVFVAEHLNEIQKLSVYPNPGKNNITINYPYTHKGTLLMEIFDSMGKKVLREKLESTNESQLKLNLENLPKGIYVLTLIDSDFHFLKTIFEKN